MSSLLGILLILIILGIVVWGAQRIFAVLPIAEPFRTVIYVVFICVVCIWLVIQLFGLIDTVQLPRLR